MNTQKPTKEEVRQWLNDRRDTSLPPPTPEQIRRELGWNLLPATR